jgi:hypothetical protein
VPTRKKKGMKLVKGELEKREGQDVERIGYQRFRVYMGGETGRGRDGPKRLGYSGVGLAGRGVVEPVEMVPQAGTAIDGTHEAITARCRTRLSLLR